MSQLDGADKTVAADTERASSAYVPPLQRTEGQPPPITAHGGLSYTAPPGVEIPRVDEPKGA